MVAEVGKGALEATIAVTKAVSETAGGKKAADELGTTAVTLTKAINNVLLPIAAVNFAFDKAREYFTERFTEDLFDVAKDIPEDKLKVPKASVAGPALQGLTYSHDEPTLRQMYLNLLRSSMDERREGADHPAFVEVIRQLTSIEADLLLKVLHGPRVQAIANVVQKIPGREGEAILVRNVVNYHDIDTKRPLLLPNLGAMYDNWVRLGLIEISFDRQISSDSAYDWVRLRPEYLRNLGPEFGERNIDIIEGIYTVTDFGNLFRKSIE